MLVCEVASGEMLHIDSGPKARWMSARLVMRLLRARLGCFGGGTAKGFEGQGIEVGRVSGARGHEIEHLDALRIEGGDINDPVFIGPVSSSARGDVDRFASFAEQFAHQFHRAFIMQLLFHFLFGRMVDVALGIDAQQVAPHAGGDGERVGDHAFSGDEDHFFGKCGKVSSRRMLIA